MCVPLIFHKFISDKQTAMLNIQTEFKFSDHRSLYDLLIPTDSKFRQLNELIDFSLIRKELVKNYCKDMGRVAVDPVILFKYLLLKAMHPASDRDLVARSYTDMSYKFFLGLNPEDDVIDPSLLTVFRRQRMKDINLMDLLLRSTIDKARAFGLLSSRKVIIDSTHTLSVFKRYMPSEAIARRSHELLLVLKESGTDAKFYSKLPKVPISKETNLMVEYAKSLLISIEDSGITITSGIQEKMNYLQEALDDIAVRAMVCKDPDARYGHKSTNKPFNGYKVHIAETEEGFITAATVTSGEKGDGAMLPELIEKSENNGQDDIKMVIADTAYCTKDNIETCQVKNIRLVAPLHPSVNGFRDKNDGFVYNKDAQNLTCPAGELSVRKSFKKGNPKKKTNAHCDYYFDVEKCRQCPLKEGCYKEGAKSKTYAIRILSGEHQRQKEFQKTPEFRHAIKMRNRIEGKNSELKNRHGMRTTISFGLDSFEIQAAVALYYVNLKRIMKLKAK